MTTPGHGAPRHRAQEIALDGLRVIRDEMPEGLIDEETLKSLDDCIESLIPMRGFGVPNAAARLSVIAQAIEVLASGLIPHVTIANSTPLEPIATACNNTVEQLKHHLG